MDPEQSELKGLNFMYFSVSCSLCSCTSHTKQYTVVTLGVIL